MDLSENETTNNVKRFLVDKAAQRPWIVRLQLFGSRARGDASLTSDYDVAVEAPGIPQDEWVRFAVEVREDIPTLCGIDLILVDQKLSTGLHKRIEREGITFYERTAA